MLSCGPAQPGRYRTISPLGGGSTGASIDLVFDQVLNTTQVVKRQFYKTQDSITTAMMGKRKQRKTDLVLVTDKRGHKKLMISKRAGNQRQHLERSCRRLSGACRRTS